MPRWLLIFSLACLGAGGALAQATGEIVGTVVDPAGVPIAGARVALKLAGSSVVYARTLTNGSGRFVLVALRPDFYNLAVEAEKFLSVTVTDRHVAAGETRSLPAITLIPGGDRGPVVSAPIPQTVDPAVSFALTPQQLSQLPTPRRDPFPLVETLPGVQNNGRATSIWGQPTTVGNITLNGLNIQTNFARPQDLNSVSLALHTDQVGEANILTGGIFGCGCSEIMFSTPSGGNGFHGAGYWLGIPNALSAQYWPGNSRNTPASTKLNQLGGNFGGALLKNRLFFFANYETDLDRSSITRTGSAPTSTLTSTDSLLQRVLAQIPASPSGIYRGTQRNGGTSNLGLIKLDYLASSRHSVTFTAAGNTSTTDDPADSSVFGSKPDTSLHVASQFYSGSWRWSISPTLTNEARLGASLPTLDYRNSLRSQFPFIAILNDPAVSVSQPMTGMDPRGMSDNLYSYQDTLHWLWGKHILQFGVWIQQYRLNTYGNNNGPLDSLTVPRYTVNNIAAGTISEIDQRFNIQSPTSGYSSAAPPHSRLSANMLSGYFHDDWKLFRSLTISFGFRYDYLSPAKELTGTAIVPSLASFQADTVYDQTLAFGFSSTHQPFYARDFDNDSPYAGAAWKPFDRLPIVIRGGVNLSYIPNNLLSNMSLYALRNPFQSFNVTTSPTGIPFSQAPPAPAPQLPSTLDLPSLLALDRTYHQAPGTVYAVSGDLRTPNVEYWNFGVETRVSGFLIDARYLGNRLNEAPRSADRNQVMLPPAYLAAFLKVRSALLAGAPTTGFPLLPGGGLCINLSTTNCQPDVHAISLIETGQAGELARWYMASGYAPDINAGYFVLGNPIAPGGIDLLSKLGTARYDALELTASRSTAKGLNVNASYVFSKVLSNLDDYQPGAIDPYLYLHNQALENAPAPFNLEHAFKLTAIWDIPFSRSATSLAGRMLNNWSLSSILIAQSGAPFSLLSGGYVVAPDGSTNLVTGLGTFVSQADSGQNTVATSLNAGQIQKFFGIRENSDGTISYIHAPATAFQEPGPATLGNLPRRMFTGPGLFNLNLGLRKVIPVAEGKQVDLRAESINLLNNVNWLVGDQTFIGNNAASAQFNNNVTQWNAPRTFQFLVRFLF